MIKTLIAALLLAAGPHLDQPLPGGSPETPAIPKPAQGGSRADLKAKLLEMAKMVGESKHKKVVLESLLFNKESDLAVVVFNEGDLKVGFVFIFEAGEWTAVPSILADR